MDLVAPILLAAVAGAIVWALCRPRYEFVVRIRDGHAEVVKGNVSGAFVRDFTELCRREELPNGTIRGRKLRQRTTLVFSREIPSPCHQQIRNIWGMG